MATCRDDVMDPTFNFYLGEAMHAEDVLQAAVTPEEIRIAKTSFERKVMMGMMWGMWNPAFPGYRLAKRRSAAAFARMQSA